MFGCKRTLVIVHMKEVLDDGFKCFGHLRRWCYAV